MFYLKLIIICTLGLLFQLAVKSKSLQDLAAKANVEYTSFILLKTDRITIIMTYIIMAMAILIFGPALDPDILIEKDKSFRFFFDLFVLPIKTIYQIIIYIIAATIGYSGIDLALRFFGKTSAFIKSRIDDKTTIADQATGNLNNPTPLK